jgi:hypothetical protein
MPLIPRDPETFSLFVRSLVESVGKALRGARGPKVIATLRPQGYSKGRHGGPTDEHAAPESARTPPRKGRQAGR